MLIRTLFGQSLHSWTDQKLLQAYCKHKREVYFDELFTRYHKMIYGYCLNRTAKREDSKDLTLRIFTKAHGQLCNKPPQQFDRWLYGIARNVCVDFIREQASRQTALKEWWQVQEAPYLDNEAFRRLIWEQELMRDEWFVKAIEQLPIGQRKCLELFFLENLSYRATAKQTGYTLAAVKSHIQNGKRRLQSWAKQQFGTRKYNEDVY